MTRFQQRQSVHIDGDKTMAGYILAILIRGENVTYDVGYMHNGSAVSSWIEEWRLEKAQ